MRVLCVLLIILLSFGSGRAGEFTLNQGYTDNQGFRVILPYENVRDLVIVRVNINGKTRKFLLDTGAPTVISKSIQRKAGYEVLSTVSSYDINNKENTSEVVNVDAIGLGDLVIKHIPALLADDNNPIFSYLGVDGIIGSNMLRNMIVRISSGDGTITFTDKIGMLDLSGAYSDEMKTDKDIQSSPVISVRLGNGIMEELLFDTGFDGFYNISINKFSMFREHEDIRVVDKVTRRDTYGMYGEEESTEKFKVLVPEYKLGGFIFRDVIAYTTNSSNSRLGAKLLKCGDVTLDYINKRFYLQPYINSGSVSMLLETEAYYCGTN